MVQYLHDGIYCFLMLQDIFLVFSLDNEANVISQIRLIHIFFLESLALNNQSVWAHIHCQDLV